MEKWYQIYYSVNLKKPKAKDIKEVAENLKISIYNCGKEKWSASRGWLQKFRKRMEEKVELGESSTQQS